MMRCCTAGHVPVAVPAFWLKEPVLSEPLPARPAPPPPPFPSLPPTDGQTGSGKTFTIYGNDKLPGLTPRGVTELYKVMDRDSGKASFRISCYLLELYCDDLSDLLSDHKKGEKMVRLAGCGRVKGGRDGGRREADGLWNRGGGGWPGGTGGGRRRQVGLLAGMRGRRQGWPGMLNGWPGGREMG